MPQTSSHPPPVRPAEQPRIRVPADQLVFELPALPSRSLLPTIVQQSVLNRSRLTLAFHFAGASFLGGVRSLQVSAQTHVQGNRDAHHNQRTHTQDQEPPDHPHSRLG